MINNDVFRLRCTNNSTSTIDDYLGCRCTNSSTSYPMIPVISISPNSTHININEFLKLSIIGMPEGSGLSAIEFLESGIRNGIISNVQISYNPNQYIDHQQHIEVIREENVIDTEEDSDFIRESYQKKIKYNKANNRAKLLLLSILDDINILRYLHDENLEIDSNLFKDIKYIIPITDKIKRIKVVRGNKDVDKKVITELCAILDAEDIPLNDWILAKVLSLRYDEKNFLSTANHWDVKENLMKRLAFIDYLKDPMESQFRW